MIQTHLLDFKIRSGIFDNIYVSRIRNVKQKLDKVVILCHFFLQFQTKEIIIHHGSSLTSPKRPLP